MAGNRAAMQAAGSIRGPGPVGGDRKQSPPAKKPASVVPFADSDYAQQHPPSVVFDWQCQRPMTANDMDRAAAEVVKNLYARQFSHRAISPEAVSRLLPVLRDDLAQGFATVDDAVSAAAAADQLDQTCERGQSPLGRFVQAHAYADDDRMASLARRLGGEWPTGVGAGLL